MTVSPPANKKISVKALGRPEDPEARDMLLSILRILEPLITKEKLQIGSLEEFYPRDRRLLGLNQNKGQKIQIRLRRRKTTQGCFFPLDELIGTTIHELVHNLIGPHNQAFYQTFWRWCKFIEEYWMHDISTKSRLIESFSPQPTHHQSQETNIKESVSSPHSSCGTSLRTLTRVATLKRLHRIVPPAASHDSLSTMCKLAVLKRLNYES